METAKQAIAFIEKAAEKLVDEKQKEFFAKTVESLNTASEMTEEDEEKVARLNDAAVKYANQLAFILFRADALGELAEEFRTLATPEETSAKVKEYEEARQSRIDSINEEHAAVVAEQKALDIFLAVIAGMTKEEAEKKMAEHEAQIAQMSQR